MASELLVLSWSSLIQLLTIFKPPDNAQCRNILHIWQQLELHRRSYVSTHTHAKHFKPCRPTCPATMCIAIKLLPVTVQLTSDNTWHVSPQTHNHRVLELARAAAGLCIHVPQGCQFSSLRG